VLDLDETVFDNSPFQTWMYRHGVTFSPARWEVWERDHPHEVRLVPGAAGFIRGAEKAGVAVVYISNRLEKHRPSTVKVLARHGLSTAGLGERLLLRAGAGDKKERRRKAEARYDVLLYVGDSLADFPADFKV